MEERTLVTLGKRLVQMGIALALGLVLAAAVIAWGVLQAKNRDQTIVVTGSAKQRITSDRVTWRANISYQSSSLADAYRALSQSVPRVRAYLQENGVAPEEMVVSAIQTQTLRGRNDQGQETNQISGYTLSQSIEVASDDVAKIGKISRQATELINQGILIESNPPQYLYTKLADLKQQMLAEAAKDARERARRIAESAGSGIGGVRAARMGVFQITAADSTQVEDYGVYDTSTVEKDITAVVTLTFAVR